MKKPSSAATDDGQPNPKQRNLMRHTTATLHRKPSSAAAVNVTLGGKPMTLADAIVRLKAAKAASA